MKLLPAVLGKLKTKNPNEIKAETHSISAEVPI